MLSNIFLSAGTLRILLFSKVFAAKSAATIAVVRVEMHNASVQ
jgi:hypothetical protein